MTLGVFLRIVTLEDSLAAAAGVTSSPQTDRSEVPIDIHCCVVVTSCWRRVTRC